MAVELGEVLLSETQIRQRVEELAREISCDYQQRLRPPEDSETPPVAGADEEAIILVGVLRGAFLFLADLIRRLTIPSRVDFIAVSSYEATTEATGAVRLVLDLRLDIAGRHVLLVEDIVDSGYTLAYLRQMLAARCPASLRCCSLLRKPSAARVEVEVDYLGFDIEDVWVVGYGLDCLDQYRGLPYIARATLSER